jgi:NAD-dependent dihydropyrimidine dehydrogenase PreA subunit
MKIDPDRCTGCGDCLPYCPAGAIVRPPEEAPRATVLEELCFECGLCRRLNICPGFAFEEFDGTEAYPRLLRALFSDPNRPHDKTLIPGRGTEESKTNDVTGRIRRNQLGICIEFGRPGIGCTFLDISSVTTRLTKLGVVFCERNPLTTLMNGETGEFPEELNEQRILSSILEIQLEPDALETVMAAILEAGKEIQTVFSLSVISRWGEDADRSVRKRLEALGLSVAPNAKMNLGLGRPLCED